MAVDNHKVVAWTPYGRKETMTILSKYMERDHNAGVVDEYHLYMNTDPDQVEDVAYAHELAERFDWVKLKERPTDLEVLEPKQLNTGRYYRYAIEPDTVYVRFDDDIVYVHDKAIERLVQHKIVFPGIASFPVIWHNAVCSYWLQRMGKIPIDGYGYVEAPYCMDPVGWGDGQFAEKIHRLLLANIRAESVDSLFLHHDIQLRLGLQFSVSCFAAHSRDYLALTPPGVLPYHEEENWHTVIYPSVSGKPNVIVSNALVAHLSFFPHTRYIRQETDILDQYRELADQL